MHNNTQQSHNAIISFSRIVLMLKVISFWLVSRADNNVNQVAQEATAAALWRKGSPFYKSINGLQYLSSGGEAIINDAAPLVTLLIQQIRRGG